VVETFSYGGLFYHLPLIILYGLGWVGGGIDDWTIVVLLRAVNTLAGIGCIWLSFSIGRLIGGAIGGAVAAWLLTLTPVFLRWSVEIHPDIPQLFWLLASIYVCCLLVGNRTNKRVVMAGLFAGLAFGTKYSGVFLLPIIGLALFFSFGGQPKVLKEQKLWLDYALALGVFVIVCGVSNFSAFWYPHTFYSDVQFERAHLSFGHVFQAKHVGVGWLVDLWQLIGWAHGFVCIGIVGWLIYNRRITKVQLLLLGWGCLFVGYLIVFANLQAGRHLLPVLPVFLALTGCGYAELKAWLSRLAKPVVTTASLVLLVALFSWTRAENVVALFEGKKHRADARDEIVAGRWLGETYSSDTTLLYHA